MIKGTLKEKLEYERYIRECEFTLEPHLYRLYTKTLALRRFIRINAHRENRELSDVENHELNFWDLMANCGFYCWGLLYTWIWNESMPSMIASVPIKPAQYYVSYQEIAEIFLQYNRRILVAALLKANVNNNTLVNALAAYEEYDVTLLAKSLEDIPLNDLFSQYVLVNVHHELFKQWIKIDNLEDDEIIEISGHRSAYQDLLDLDDTDFEKKDVLDRITDMIHKINNYQLEVIDASIVKKACIVLAGIYRLLKTELGKTDPIVETVKKILDRDSYQRISQMYVDFWRDQQEIKEFIIEVSKFMGCFIPISQEEINELINLTLNEECENDNVDKRPVIANNDTRQLVFPTRFINCVQPNQIYAHEQVPILIEIYHAYGGYFENMSCEDFLYLFGAASTKRPVTYNPPYYWSGDVAFMKAILRVFYTQQPRLVKELILHTSDKETGAKSHDWSRNKNRVAYRDIEMSIIKIVHGVTGKTLKEL